MDEVALETKVRSTKERGGILGRYMERKLMSLPREICVFGDGHPARKKPLTVIFEDDAGYTEVSRGHIS